MSLELWDVGLNLLECIYPACLNKSERVLVRLQRGRDNEVKTNGWRVSLLFLSFNPTQNTIAGTTEQCTSSTPTAIDP